MKPLNHFSEIDEVLDSTKMVCGFGNRALGDAPGQIGEPLYIHAAAKFDLRKLSGDPGASGECRARLWVSMTDENRAG